METLKTSVMKVSSDKGAYPRVLRYWGFALRHPMMGILSFGGLGFSTTLSFLVAIGKSIDLAVGLGLIGFSAFALFHIGSIWLMGRWLNMRTRAAISSLLDDMKHSNDPALVRLSHVLSEVSGDFPKLILDLIDILTHLQARVRDGTPLPPGFLTKLGITLNPSDLIYFDARVMRVHASMEHMPAKELPNGSADSRISPDRFHPRRLAGMVAESYRAAQRLHSTPEGIKDEEDFLPLMIGMKTMEDLLRRKAMTTSDPQYVENLKIMLAISKELEKKPFHDKARDELRLALADDTHER